MRNFLLPMGIRVIVYEQDASGIELNNIRVLGEAPWTTPDVENLMVDGTRVNKHEQEVASYGKDGKGNLTICRA